MQKHHNKAYVIPPQWKELALYSVLTGITGMMWFVGITTERPGHANPWELCIILIICIILEWKSLRLSQSYVEVFRCSILRRCIQWTDIERLELLSKDGRRKYLLIELTGCPSCPKSIESCKTYLYLWKHPRKLVKIKLKPNKEEEQIKMIEFFHPIDASIFW